MECPGCHGEKEVRFLIPVKAIPCPRCFGLGAVPEEQREWIKDGKKMREDRIKRGILCEKKQSAGRWTPFFFQTWNVE
jgi:hypothetical protein